MNAAPYGAGLKGIRVPLGMPDPTPEQEDRVRAAADLVRRSGGTSITIGYVRDGVPPEHAGWYAQADYAGYAVVWPSRAHPADMYTVPGPVEAAEGLAAVALRDALCRRCGQPVLLLQGDQPDVPDAPARCVWRRAGSEYVPSCDKAVDESLPLPVHLEHSAKPWWWGQ